MQNNRLFVCAMGCLYLGLACMLSTQSMIKQFSNLGTRSKSLTTNLINRFSALNDGCGNDTEKERHNRYIRILICMESYSLTPHYVLDYENLQSDYRALSKIYASKAFMNMPAEERVAWRQKRYDFKVRYLLRSYQSDTPAIAEAKYLDNMRRISKFMVKYSMDMEGCLDWSNASCSGSCLMQMLRKRAGSFKKSLEEALRTYGDIHEPATQKDIAIAKGAEKGLWDYISRTTTEKK